ncbi:hypothetical protein BDZ89DRAFT_1135702 [Hymenopellis radicata]|nr:hypothetical protein BDZ89DRAFT_1135702 [Hymenopellis radicata]
MKDLVIKEYHYSPDDIVTLIDDGGEPHFQPTRENILRRDRQPRARREGAVITSSSITPVASNIYGISQGSNAPISELRARLVDSLPVGSQLIAIFDTCHSASLLNLDHFRCNRVYVPYVSKGEHCDQSLWTPNVRKNALEQGYDGPFVSTRGIYQTKRVTVSDSMVKTRKSSVQHCEGRQRVQTCKLTVKTAYEREPSMVATPISSIELCESPITLFHFPCDGWCKPDGSEHEMAQVISLGSCTHSHIFWTSALVKILRENPNPSLKDLMLRVSHDLHKSAINMHDGSKEYKKAMKQYWRWGGKQPAVPTGMNHFEELELSSHQPLNLEKTTWNP